MSALVAIPQIEAFRGGPAPPPVTLYEVLSALRGGVNGAVARVQAGRVDLVDGRAIVNLPAMRSDSVIVVSYATLAGTPGFLSVPSGVIGKSFVIQSSSVTDTSSVNWILVNP